VDIEVQRKKWNVRSITASCSSHRETCYKSSILCSFNLPYLLTEYYVSSRKLEAGHFVENDYYSEKGSHRSKILNCTITLSVKSLLIYSDSYWSSPEIVSFLVLLSLFKVNLHHYNTDLPHNYHYHPKHQPGTILLPYRTELNVSQNET
jgi:hypothetical protein